MPIYIDRHNVPSATHEDLVNAHELDLAVQSEHGVKFLTYWFDPRDGTAICLVDAPSKEALEEVHRAAHGGVPAEIIEVRLTDVLALLGRVTDPEPVVTASGEMTIPPVDSALRAILFTDLKDSTSMMNLMGQFKGLEALERHDRIITHTVEAYGGTVVKHTGDGFMASFPVLAESVKCAINIQQQLAAYNAEVPDLPLHVRIGINAGLPIERGGDLFGSVIQLASRVCAHADPDRILVAGIMRELCEDSTLHASFRDAGRYFAKGFISAVQLYEVRWQSSEAAPATKPAAAAMPNAAMETTETNPPPDVTPPAKPSGPPEAIDGSG